MNDVKAVGRFVIMLLLWTAPSLSNAYWMSAADSKPVTELQLMNDLELSEEAFGACNCRTFFKRRGTINDDVIAAHKYLERIRLVVREKHRGSVPQWMTDYLAAAPDNASRPATDFDPEQCKRIREALVSASKEAPKRASRQAAQPMK